MRAWLVVSLVYLCTAAKVSYDGYQVLRVQTPRVGLETLQSRDVELGLDIWGRGTPDSFDIMVKPSTVELVKKFLTGMDNTTYYTHIQNVQESLDLETEEILAAKKRNVNVGDAERCGSDAYCTYEETDAWITALAGKYSEMVKTVTPPRTSHQGRKIMAIEISKPDANAPHTVFLDALIHAREWITGGSINYFIRWAVEGMANGDPDALALFDKAKFVIIPIVNVDGYAYTQSDRMWRKTRTPNPSVPQCIGTDANRNMPMGWGGAGSSNNPCSDIYHGASAFSEPCTKASYDDLMGPYMRTGSVKIGVSMHAYGRMWMTPYGYSRTKPSNYNDQMRIGQLAVNAIRARLGQTYSLGTVYDVIYQASGGTVDYLFGQDATGSGSITVPYSYTPELDTTFTTPVSRIIPTGEAVRDAVIAMVGGL